MSDPNVQRQLLRPRWPQMSRFNVRDILNDVQCEDICERSRQQLNSMGVVLSVIELTARD